MKTVAKKNRFAASLFGLLWVAIALNYAHIYVVHHQTVSPDLIDPDIADLPTQRNPPTKGKQIKAKRQQTIRRSIKNGKNNEKRRDFSHNLPSSQDATNEKHAKHEFFLKQHHKRKQRLVDLLTQNATSETHKAELETLARKTLFVDLERDEHPHKKHNISNHHQDPWFVLHIGPPKTATTTIQCGLEKHSLRLAKTDGYHYLGGGCGSEGKSYIMPNGEAVVLRKLIIDALMAGPKRKNPEAMQHLRDLIARSKSLRKKGRSVILSSELIGSKLPASARVMNTLKEIILSNTTTNNGINFSPSKVKIVLAYRHFIDWLPSYHYQRHALYFRDEPFAREDERKKKKFAVQPFLEYAETYLSKWEDHQRMAASQTRNASAALEPSSEESILSNDESSNDDTKVQEHGNDDDEDLEDDDLEDEEDIGPLVSFLPKNRFSTHPTWWLYQLWSSHFPLPNQVEVYDMHAPMNSNRPNDDMVTNFVCNMLPGANRTCSKLLNLEDDRERLRQQEQQSNGTALVANDNHYLEDAIANAFIDEPDYDSLELHTRGSLLHRKEDTNDEPKKKKGARPSMATGDNGMSVRASSDFDAVMLVENLLVTGGIRLFDFSKYGPEFFESNPSRREISKESHKGYNKRELIEVADKLLKEHGLKASAPDEKYYDCMSKDLEDRLLKASLTFVDLMYKKTEMLTTSALASTREMAGGSSEQKKAAIEEEKEKRYQQALSEHARLFEKNKAKGKYCDISPSKVFQEIPAIHKALTALSFKPKYKSIKFERLPKSVQPHVQTLFKNSKRRWVAAHKVGFTFGKLGAKKLAAAFHLGWEDKFQNEPG